MTENDKENIKQDINFLENPLWQPKERNKNIVYELKDENGFKYESLRGIPSKVDMMILYYLMLMSQENRFTDTIETSFYQIMKGCDMSSNKRMKERIVESLERWKRVTISFQGIFFDGVKYHLAEFGIINDFWISDNRRNVKINFNQNWIETIKQSSFFKYISFTEMKYLRSPIAIRLYEILSKSFYKRNEWKIGVQKLKDKIPIQDKHYSEIKRKIESAVNTINRKTDMNIKVSAEKTKKNDGVITFSKIQKRMVDYMKETQNNIYFNMPEMESYAGFIEGMDTETLKNLKSQFVEKEIQNNTFLQNRYRKEGFDNLSIQKSFISFAKRNNNE